ncbi:MAG: beta-phosphoglucomutase family hydrolase [Dehalococcoidia bacterium]
MAHSSKPTTGQAVTISKQDFDAVIFDMDGVVTDTASVHAAAWKQLFDDYLRERDGAAYTPFDADQDYRRYVDGKPRYDGVAMFLESRGISIPYGDPNDPPEQETACGLGNRKNGYFTQRLEEQGVQAFPSTVALIEQLRAASVKTAIFSASKNCEAVLRAGGVRDLFEVKVDGVEAEERGLAGKPDPAVLLEAARRLGVSPDRSVIVEDAIAGVQAGRAGGFALVIGVNRSDEPGVLTANGATVEVTDLAAVSFADH